MMKLPILVFVGQSALAATCADLASLHPRTPTSHWRTRWRRAHSHLGGWDDQLSRHGAPTETRRPGPQGASFAMRHPEKLVDFGYRAVHEMTVEAKTPIAAFYSRIV
jgi:feruloyl esterase